MNHNVTFAIVAIAAAGVLIAATFAIPQQALAYRHHHNNHNSIKVDQQINQQNLCTGVSDTTRTLESTVSSTVCVNQADNSADIHK
jgi:hypothetical protein